MKKSQSGFTLIELVVVIVLLGILGVTALGKFQDLSGEAALAATTGIASELGSASTLNYAKGLISTTGYPVTLTSNAVCTTGLLQGLFQSGVWPTGYTVAAGAAGEDCSGGAGTAAACDITHTSSSSVATASIICGG